MKITGLIVRMDHPGRIDAGEYRKPIYSLYFYKDDKPCKRPVACSGDSKPLGKDLEEACKGLGLKLDAIYAIPFQG